MKKFETKWMKYIGGAIGGVIAGIVLMFGGTQIVYPAISQLVGLSVAQSSTLWNSVVDAAKGDGLSSGILGQSLYLWNGVTFDRVRGDTTNGMDVDITRMSGSITPSDAYANPTTANQMWSLTGVFNGTTWDRMRSATADASASTGMTAVGNMGFNGTTWDRLRSSITNGLLVEKKTVGATNFNILRADIAAVSANLAFGFTSRKILVSALAANTANVCIDWLGGTAVCPAANTAGDGVLTAGTSILLDDYAVTSISVIAASGTQSFSVSAWN